MVNEYVTHKKFGEGVIIEVEGLYIRVKFEAYEGIKTFVYPEAFEQFITFRNPIQQAEVMRLIAEEKKRLKYEKIEAEKQKAEQKEREKVESLKNNKKTTRTRVSKKVSQ